MDLRKINNFVRVVECGSFTRAAGLLAMAQSALSRQVRELENEVGGPLLYRNGRGVVLTDIGRAFLPRARSLLIEADTLLAEMKALRGVVAGAVTLGVPPSVSRLLLAPLLNRVAEDHPAVELHIIEGFSGHIQEWLLSGRIDLAVLYNTPASALLGDRLLSEEMLLVGTIEAAARWGERVAFAEIVRQPLVLPGRPHGLRLLVDAACVEAGIRLTIKFQVDALETIKKLVGTGATCTILPRAAVLDELRVGDLGAAVIERPTISRELLLARSTVRPESIATRAVARLLQSEVETQIQNGTWPVH